MGFPARKRRLFLIRRNIFKIGCKVLRLHYGRLSVEVNLRIAFFDYETGKFSSQAFPAELCVGSDNDSYI